MRPFNPPRPFLKPAIERILPGARELRGMQHCEDYDVPVAYASLVAGVDLNADDFLRVVMNE